MTSEVQFNQDGQLTTGRTMIVGMVEMSHMCVIGTVIQ